MGQTFLLTDRRGGDRKRHTYRLRQRLGGKRTNRAYKKTETNRWTFSTLVGESDWQTDLSRGERNTVGIERQNRRQYKVDKWNNILHFTQVVSSNSRVLFTAYYVLDKDKVKTKPRQRQRPIVRPSLAPYTTFNWIEYNLFTFLIEDYHSPRAHIKHYVGGKHLDTDPTFHFTKIGRKKNQ